MQISRDDNIKFPIAPHFVDIMRNDKMRCLCIFYEKIELLWYEGDVRKQKNDKPFRFYIK